MKPCFKMFLNGISYFGCFKKRFDFFMSWISIFTRVFCDDIVFEKKINDLPTYIYSLHTFYFLKNKLRTQTF